MSQIPYAPRFGADQHNFSKAQKRTPVQLEIGDKEYTRIRSMWESYCSGPVKNERYVDMCVRLGKKQARRYPGEHHAPR